MKTKTIGSAFRGRLLTFAILFGTMSTLPGCGGSGDASQTSANDIYYRSLTENNYVGHAAAQAPADLFAPVKHFDLVQDTSPLLSAAAAAGSYTAYRPAHALVARANPALPGSSSSDAEIPSLKSPPPRPAACDGLADEALKTCLEDAATQGASQAEPHMSHFDARALELLFGASFDDALVSKVIDAALTHVDSTTRAGLLAQLSDYINDAPAHQSLDLTRYNVFDRSGFFLSGVTFSDASRGDVDGDGDLDPHSTIIVQISKKIDYTRSGQSELDAALQSVHGQLPVETYLVNLQAFIHLKDLSGFRQAVPPRPDAGAAPATVEEEFAQLDREAQAAWMNRAMDANILKTIVDNPDPIPWASSEYALSFQVSPDNVTTHLAPALAAALDSGNATAARLIEQHINAQTAILTGAGNTAPQSLAALSTPRVNVFYQVSQPRFGLASSWSASGLEYGMFDAAGNRVAISDPASGALVLAGEGGSVQTPLQAPRRSAFTKAGACKGDKSYWSYWPSQARTGKFGRGINWILTESIIHNQVGDYKNIHWYQSVWKSSAQVAIKSGMWVLANYLKVQWKTAGLAPDKSDYAVFYIVEVLMPYLNEILRDADHREHGRTFDIAGFSYKVDGKVLRFFEEAKLYGKDATFGQKARAVIKGAALSFLIDRVSDGIGQSLDVTVTGWQDYSDSSHYGCFDFSY